MSDDDYYAKRAATERHMAETATDPKIAALHWELASLYEKLVSQHQDKESKAA
jgi:hypothetical protein